MIYIDQMTKMRNHTKIKMVLTIVHSRHKHKLRSRQIEKAPSYFLLNNANEEYWKISRQMTSGKFAGQYTYDIKPPKTPKKRAAKPQTKAPTKPKAKGRRTASVPG